MDPVYWTFRGQALIVGLCKACTSVRAFIAGRRNQSRLPKRRASLKKGDEQSPKKKRIMSGNHIASPEPCGVELTLVTLNISMSIQVDDWRTGLNRTFR
jgi:hypothetical protein